MPNLLVWLEPLLPLIVKRLEEDDRLIEVKYLWF